MPLKIRSFFILFVLLISFASCKDKSNDAGSYNPDIKSEIAFPKGFEAFFTRFHTDSLFQIEHILFPLEGKNSSYDPFEIYYWQKDTWKLHGEFDESLTDFTRSYQVFNEIVIETIQDKYAFSKMERRFAKIGDEWMLIYYAITTSDQ